MKNGSRCTAVSERGIIPQQLATRLQRDRARLAWQFSFIPIFVMVLCGCFAALTAVLGVVQVQPQLLRFLHPQPCCYPENMWLSGAMCSSPLTAAGSFVTGLLLVACGPRLWIYWYLRLRAPQLV